MKEECSVCLCVVGAVVLVRGACHSGALIDRFNPVYRMRFNFRRVYILRIFHIHGFRIFNFVDAGHCSCVSIDV